MGNTKLGLLNLVTQPGVVLKNGTGGGAPARIETAPYVMENALLGDRYTLWKTSAISTPTQYPVDIDLGAGFLVGCAAMNGFRPVNGFGPLVDVSYQVSTYTPGGAWTFVGSISGPVVNLRDDGIEFAPVTARFWRFVLNPGGASNVFTLGKFFLGSLTDLGAQHSPGSQYTPFGNRSEIVLPGGAVVLTELGDDGAEFSITWQVASSSVESAFLSMQTLAGTQLLLWPDGHFYETYLKERRVTQTRNFKNDYTFILGRMS
jgi:hypothetical protein